MIVLKIFNNEIVEITRYASTFELSQEQIDDGYVIVEETNPPSLGDYQSLAPEKFVKQGDKWVQTWEVITMPFDQAKDAKEREINRAFNDDILWTDAEFQFYNKWKETLTAGDTHPYSEWFAKIITYWKEAIDNKFKNNDRLSSATSLADLKKIVYNPIHAVAKSDLKPPTTNE